MANYLINDENLALVEGETKASAENLAGRVDTLDDQVADLQSRVKAWEMLATLSVQEAGGTAYFTLSFDYAGLTEICIQFDTGTNAGLADNQGTYKNLFFVPLLVLDGTSATSRYTLSNDYRAAAGRLSMSLYKKTDGKCYAGDFRVGDTNPGSSCRVTIYGR